VERSIARKLLDLNRRFYEAAGGEFAASRGRLHPGMVRALEMLDPRGGLLDLGCGHGRIARAWKAGSLPGEPSHYVGVENSRALLALAPPQEENLRFLAADLAEPGWEEEVRALGFPLETALCFSFLHHIPGRDLRLDLLRRTAGLLPPGGGLALSVWQFLHVPGLAARIRPWKEAGLDPGELDAGDLLYPWGGEGGPLRYVHHFREEEVRELLEEAGFQVLRAFRSDGRTGDLGLYLLGGKR